MSYNGWTNYATWRVNLEIFDGGDFSDVIANAGDVYRAGQALKEYAEEVIFMDIPEGLAESYARAFISEVNWTEIAEHYMPEDEESEED